MTSIHVTVASLIDRLDRERPVKAEAIAWGSPIPVFGDISVSAVASLGLNPSSREFVDESGSELDGPDRRFHTLKSLGLSSWSDVDARHLDLIVDACYSYFDWNPYDAWFKKLDIVVSGADASFYDPSRRACHLDLIPYATKRKWAELKAEQRSALLSSAGDTLGLLLRDSPVRTLILNGSSVVQTFQAMADVELQEKVMPDWALPRRKGSVAGVAYWGEIDALSGVYLDRTLLVIGFNHNLQSSFGVTKNAVSAIAAWVSWISGQGTL